MTITKRDPLTALAIFAALVMTTLVVAVLGATPAQATNQEPEVCYEQVPFQERLYEKQTTVEQPKFKTEYQYQKQVKGVVQQRDNGRCQWHTTGQSFDWEWWRGNSTQWSFQDVEVLDSGNHNDVQETWTQGNHQWRKKTTEFRYVQNGVTRQVPDGTEIVPGPVESSGWITGTLDAPWVLVDERTSYEQVEVECPPVTEPPTTEPPTTEPPTTEPPVTVPPTTPPCVGICGPASVPTTTPPFNGSDCVINFSTGEVLPSGSYVIYTEPVPEAVGTIFTSGQLCGPAATTPPPAAPSAPAQTQLPATGSENWVIAAIAVGLIVAGGALLRARKF